MGLHAGCAHLLRVLCCPQHCLLQQRHQHHHQQDVKAYLGGQEVLRAEQRKAVV